MQGILALIVAMFLVNQAVAGTWTDHQFIYKPSLGARGETEKNTFDAGLDRVDAHQGRYKTLGDPGYDTLAAALTTIGSNERTLVIPAGTVSITANTTIPANVHLLVLKGGKFDIAEGVTLTINGPFQAGLYQVFSTGTGKVNFTINVSLEKVLPQWFGAKGDGTADDSLAIAAAIGSVAGSNVPVWFSKGSYKMSRQGSYTDSCGYLIYYGVRIQSKVKLLGPGTITFSIADADYVQPFAFSGASDNYLKDCDMVGLRFEGIGTPSAVGTDNRPTINAEYCEGLQVRNCRFNNTRGGVVFKRCKGSTVEGNLSTNPYSSTPKGGAHFAVLSEGEGNTISNNATFGSTGDGDIYVLGSGCRNNSIVNNRVHAYAIDDPAKQVYENAQNICVDGACVGTRVVGNYVYGGCYGIDVKGGAIGTTVQGNTAEKCWVGIAVREGELGGVTVQTSIVGNIVLPNGGNGKTAAYMGLTYGGQNLTATGITVSQNAPYGTVIQGNVISNKLTGSSTNASFVGILVVQGYTTYTDYHTAGLTINSNQIITYMNHSSIYSASRWPALDVRGPNATTYLFNVNISDNHIKSNPESGLQRYGPLCYLYRTPTWCLPITSWASGNMPAIPAWSFPTA